MNLRTRILAAIAATCAMTSLGLMPSGMAQGLDEQCQQNLAEICGDQNASTCFSDENNWSRVLPVCEGDVQMLVGMANEALDQLMKEGASLGGNVRSGPGTNHGTVGSLAEGTLVSLEENTGVMFDGYPWFRIVQYDMSTGAELMSGYQWGGILCSFLDVPGVYQACPAAWSDNPALLEQASGAMITEDPIAPVHGNSDEDNADIDAATIMACISNENEMGRDGRACIGALSGTCLDEDTQGTTVSMRQCIGQEHAAWDQLLNEDYQTLLASLDSDADRTSLRDAQRLWNQFVAAFCPLSYQFNQGSMFLLTADQCMMEMTARQDLELRALMGGEM